MLNIEISRTSNFFELQIQQCFNLNIQHIFCYYQNQMAQSKAFIALLVLVQLLQVFSSSNLRFDINNFKAYLNAGNCFIQPFVSTGSSSRSSDSQIGYVYYNLPYGWRQYGKYVSVPNLLSNSGSWNFGAKATYNNEQINQIFRVNLRGLQIQLAPSTGSSWKNLVIGSNYRTDTVSDSDWSNFLGSISRNDGWFNGAGSNSYWFPGGSNSRSGSSSSSSSSSSSFSVSTSTGSGSLIGSSLGNLFGGSNEYDSSVRTGIIFGTSTTTPSQFATSRATSDDMRAALDQQYNANKALNDLNTLIGQLTANVNGVSPTVQKLQTELNDLRSTSSSCNNRILELSNSKLRAETAVKEISDQIQSVRARLNEFIPAINSLTDRRDQLVRTRDNIERSNNPKSSLLTQLTTRYSSCNSQIESIRAEYTKAQTVIQTNNNNIRTIENNAADAPRQIELATQQLRVVDSTISDLEARLNDARTQKSKLQGDITNYNNIVRSSNNQVATLRSQNSRIQSQLTTIQSNIDSQVLQCSSTQRQIDDIRSQIAKGQKDYDDLVRQIQVQDSLIASKRNQIERFQSETNSLPLRLSSLQSDLTNAQTAVSRQYFICNQANDAVSNAESNLRAAQLRYETENKFLTDAQSKLATFTAQKKAADDTVNRLLSDANRYTASPSSSTTVVTVVPSGGISGVVSGSGSVPSYQSVFNTFSSTPVGLLPNYMTRVYGPSVSDFFSSTGRSLQSTQATMYPVNSVTYDALLGRSSAGIFSSGSTYLSGISASQIGSSSVPSGILGDFSCSGSSDLSGYGRISSVQPGYITVLTPDNKTVNLRVSSCTRIESHRPGDIASPNDYIAFKGLKAAPNNCKASDITLIPF